jgi:hypothetical protein
VILIMMNQLSHRRNEGSATHRLSSSASSEAMMPSPSYGRDDEDSGRPDVSKRIRTTVTNILKCSRGGTNKYRFIALLMVVVMILATRSSKLGMKRKEIDRKTPRQQSIPTNSSLNDLWDEEVPTCVYSYEGGWGNNVYATLIDVLCCIVIPLQAMFETIPKKYAHSKLTIRRHPLDG